MVTDLTLIDDASHAPTIAEREILDLPIPPHGQNDLRCIQLMQYICETYVHRFNLSPNQEELSFSNGELPIVGYEFRTNDDENSTVLNVD